jgi:hypothetical protein
MSNGGANRSVPLTRRVGAGDLGTLDPVHAIGETP